jgi:hypothetical protein
MISRWALPAGGTPDIVVRRGQLRDSALYGTQKCRLMT